MSGNIKGHLLLRQAGSDATTRNVIVGSAAGCYEIGKISATLRQAFLDARKASHNPTARDRGRWGGRGRGASCRRNRQGYDENYRNDSDDDFNHSRNHKRGDSYHGSRIFLPIIPPELTTLQVRLVIQVQVPPSWARKL